MDGKGPSIWDAFTHTKGKVFRNETGDAACDGYYKVQVSLRRTIPLETFCSHFMTLISHLELTTKMQYFGCSPATLY